MQVTYFEDSLAYRAPTISMAGATFISSKAVTNDAAAPGTWKTLQSIWLIQPGSGAASIQIQGDAAKGLLVDQ